MRVNFERVLSASLFNRTCNTLTLIPQNGHPVALERKQFKN